MSSKSISKLKPLLVWNLFYEISKIPRPSKKEEKIREWVKTWAKTHNIIFNEDSIGNILLKTSATVDCESYPTLVLQAHMDMVCQKNPESKINFDEDPISLIIDGNKITADGTTLGADNGIGFAMSLASLIAPIEHGPLEVLLTVDEETGLTGAFNVEEGFFTGKYLINVDSEELGIIYISSAGGGDISLQIPINKIEATENFSMLKLKVGGLHGGHSGVDIHLPRLNALKVLNEILLELSKEFMLKIHDYKGGSAHNAIPREAECSISIPKVEINSCLNKLKQIIENVKAANIENEPKLIIEISDNCTNSDNLNINASNELISLIESIPHGVLSWSPDIADLVETSSNLAIIDFNSELISIKCSVRSAITEEVDRIRDQIKKLGKQVGADFELSPSYPGWKPEPESKFLKYILKKYNENYNGEIQLKAIHAGLECGLFKRLDPDLQIVSIGPEIKNAHSPNEYVLIDTVEKFWEILVEIIKSANEI